MTVAPPETSQRKEDGDTVGPSEKTKVQKTYCPVFQGKASCKGCGCSQLALIFWEVITERELQCQHI